MLSFRIMVFLKKFTSSKSIADTKCIKNKLKKLQLSTVFLERGQGSQISTNQKRGCTVFLILIG